MRLPNFLCIGAQKSGTTLLAEVLKQHQAIFIPEIKEPHFFDDDENFGRGAEWYRSTFFQGAEGYDFVGDITPAYIFFEQVPERMRLVLGADIKLILMMRNPVERAYSHYWMSFKSGYEKLSFEKAIAMEHARMGRGPFERYHFSYVSRGFYSEQIRRYLKFFPMANMKFILFEEFIKDITAEVRDTLQFLGCEYKAIRVSTKKVNAGDLNFSEYLEALKANRSLISGSSLIRLLRTALGGRMSYPPLRRETRSLLFDVYEEEISELESLIGRSLPLWYCNAELK